MSDVAGIPAFTTVAFEDAAGVDGSVAANARDDPNKKQTQIKQNTLTVLLKTFLFLWLMMILLIFLVI
jgi:hypothetical protein